METLQNIFNQIAAGQIKEAWESVQQADWLARAVLFVSEKKSRLLFFLPVFLIMYNIIKWLWKQIKDYL